MTAPAFRRTASASKSRRRSRSAPAITAPPAAVLLRSTGSARRGMSGGCSAHPRPRDRQRRACHRRSARAAPSACLQPISTSARCMSRAPMRGLTALARWSKSSRRMAWRPRACTGWRRSTWSSPISCCEPLLRLATPLRSLVARGGHIVLSGIVPAQANAVIAAYRPLALERRLDLDGWTTLVFIRRATNRLGVAARVRAS